MPSLARLVAVPGSAPPPVLAETARQVVARILVAAISALAWGACSGGSTTSPETVGHPLLVAGDAGTIHGTVTIGPLCPVERIPPDPACRPTPELYSTVQVVIRAASGDELGRVPLDATGSYSVALDPGTYLVDTTWRGPGSPPAAGGGGAGAASGSSEPGHPPAPPDTGVVPPAPPDTIGSDSSITGPDPVPPLPWPWSPDTLFPRTEDEPHSNLPVRVDLAPGAVVRIDIALDTGIR